MSYFKEMKERAEEFEKSSKINLMKGLPIILRLDGSAFSKFTKGLERPFDERLSQLIIECCKFMVEETNARIGFCGSDEISLILWEEDINSQTIYNGRVEKLLSELASKLSVRFNKLLPKYLPEKIDAEPFFDCKVWNVPSIEDAVNALWIREESVTNNAISMASQVYYSHSELNGINSKEKQEMLFKSGVNFNDYPIHFKRGVYIQRKKILRKFTTEEIENLPLMHEARRNQNLEIERSCIELLNIPKLSSIKNKVDVLIYGKDVEKYE